MANRADKAKLKEISARNLIRIPKTGTIRQKNIRKNCFLS